MSNVPDLRPFPMQKGPPIPWFMAEAIHTHLYRDASSQTLERLAQRGGFSWAEVAYMWEDVEWRTPVEHRTSCSTDIRQALRTLESARVSE